MSFAQIAELLQLIKDGDLERGPGPLKVKISPIFSVGRRPVIPTPIPNTRDDEGAHWPEIYRGR